MFNRLAISLDRGPQGYRSLIIDRTGGALQGAEALAAARNESVRCAICTLYREGNRYARSVEIDGADWARVAAQGRIRALCEALLDGAEPAQAVARALGRRRSTETAGA